MINFNMYVRTVVSLNVAGMRMDSTQSLLKEFLQVNDVDIAFLQEVNVQSSKFLHGYQTIFNPGNERGTAMIVREGLRVEQLVLDVSRRATSMVVDGINMINVYAPSGTNRIEERRKFFTESMTIHLNKSAVNMSLLGGDFNSIEEARDSRSGNVNRCRGLEGLIRVMGLADVWRLLRGNETVFTFSRSKAASRLDRFYVNNVLKDHVTSIAVKPVAFLITVLS